MELENFTITDINQGLRQKKFSAYELTSAYLQKIEADNSRIFAYLTTTAELALQQAKNIDQQIARGEAITPLAGVPLAIKDNIMVKDTPCTAASKILENYIAPYDAFVIKKLKQQGAIILGKTNMDEFAMGSSTESSAFGPTRNPHDVSCVPGGSSGGSAAAVAGNLCAAALGSDTGGSIRQPAFFCGISGLKPTYGAVSRYGCIAFASSLDQIGPLAKTVEDAQIVFEAISGRDVLDSTSSDTGGAAPKKHYRAGIPKEYFIKGTDPRIEAMVNSAIKKFEELGNEVVEISLPHTKYALPCYYIIATAEASANLARYDGIRYGWSAKTGKNDEDGDLLDIYLQSRGQGFGAEVKRRIMLGTYVLSAGYYDAYYGRAQKVRTLIKQDFDKAFQQVDVIFTPTSPTLAFKIGEKINDPLTMYLQDIFTISINLAGVPAISIPLGLIDNLPSGMQIIAEPFNEQILFDAAKKLEQPLL